MFDTDESKVSENGPMYISENHAEEFAEKRGFELAIKTFATEEIISQYIPDIDADLHSIHNEAVEKKIHVQSFTYIKSNEIPISKRIGNTKVICGGNELCFTVYKILKVETKAERNFSKFYIKIHKKEGPIDKYLKNKK